MGINITIFQRDKKEMIDDLDLHPDVYLGRLLCSNTSEVNTMVHKIISYEENTHGQDWFKRIILCGGDTYCSIALKLLNLLMDTKGFSLRCEASWMARATNSFPVPLSPVMRIVLSPMATVPMVL